MMEAAITLPLDVIQSLVWMAHPRTEADNKALAIAEREIAQVKEMVGK